MMTETQDKIPFAEFVALDDECKRLLVRFYQWLQDEREMSAEDASPLAHAADRYLRDFVADLLMLPPAASSEKLVFSYLGNWYPASTLEPSHVDIDVIVRALKLLHAFYLAESIVPAEVTDGVQRALEDSGYFHDRLEKFWELGPDDVAAWCSEHDYRPLVCGGGTRGSVQ